MLGGWGGGGHPDARSQKEALPAIMSEEDTALWRAPGKMLGCPHGPWGLAHEGYSIHAVLTRTGTHASHNPPSTTARRRRCSSAPFYRWGN